MPHGIRFHYASLPEGQMHYAEAGEGEPLLLLHASPRSGRSFHRLMPLLAGRLRCIAVDMPGFGNSSPTENLTSLDDVAASYVALMDALGIRRANVLGLHTGNKIGAALAARWPARVAKVVVLGQTHSIIADPEVRDREIRRLSRQHFPDFTASTDGTHHLRRWLIAQTVAQGYWWTPTLLNGRDVHPDRVEDARLAVIDYLSALPSQLRMYEAVYAFDLNEAFRRMLARTLVVELCTPQEAHFGPQAELLCRIMRDATFTTIENADGRVVETRPAEVAERVLPFLTEA